MIAVERLADVEAFLIAAGPFLADREAEHNLILGICSNLAARPWPSDQPPAFFVVRSGPRVVLAAIWTPPYNLVLSEVDEALAVDGLADAAADDALPGVLGPTGSAGSFAARWCRTAGRLPELAVAERIYRLTQVRPPAQPPGHLRLATVDDGALVTDWYAAFTREALPADAPPLDPTLVDRRIAEGGIYLWDDAGPVSVTGVGARTPNGVRVGPVYTPPDRRGRGYASACVAAASQAQLDAGRSFVFLFTDLANPTSNRIYRAIGYEPIRDIESWRFRGTPGPSGATTG